MMPAAQGKNIELVKTIPADLPVIDGDAKRLHQVLGNVLSNAVKFTPGGGRIDVRCAYQDDAIVIEVEDSGAGIAPEFLPYVFDRFRQADSSAIRRHGARPRTRDHPPPDRATRRGDSRDERRARAGHHGAHSTAGVGRRI